MPLQGIQHIWVDNPLQQETFLRRLWKGLQSVKDDLFHWLDRINRTIPAGHPLKRKNHDHCKLHYSSPVTIVCHWLQR